MGGQGMTDRAQNTLPLGQAVLRSDRADGAQRLVQSARTLAGHYRLTVGVEQGPYCLEVTLNGLGGTYSRGFLQEFTNLLSLAHRVSFFPSRGMAGEVLVTLEYDTHDYYFAGTKLNEG